MMTVLLTVLVFCFYTLFGVITGGVMCTMVNNSRLSHIGDKICTLAAICWPIVWLVAPAIAVRYVFVTSHEVWQEWKKCS